MRAYFAAGLLLVSTTLSGASVAAAPEADRLKTAAEEFDAGRRSYKIKDFENAAAHFENADRDAPSPEALQSAMRARKEAQQRTTARRRSPSSPWAATRATER